ncbi:MAG: regulatory protein RecX [Thiomicrospira sp.]|jgi:regulatory protein|nr:regulatory protein RecX [Thiomicrospira sp.]
MKLPTDLTFQQVLARAQSLLAMREHGAKELKQKLLQKLPQLNNLAGLLDEVLAYCQAQNWQSDARYIDSYVRMACEKGQGALKIRQHLQQTSDQRDLIEQALARADEDWLTIAQAALLKKYGEIARPVETKDYAKRVRFLQSRGFTMSQCYRAFEPI